MFQEKSEESSDEPAEPDPVFFKFSLKISEKAFGAALKGERPGSAQKLL